MSDEKKPESLQINEEESVVIEEEGFDVSEGEGNNGVKAQLSIAKT